MKTATVWIEDANSSSVAATRNFFCEEKRNANFYFYYITSQSLYSITRRIRISRLTTTPGSTTPTLYEQCVGSLTSHSINIGKDCETGPTVFRPYPRRLESLTICRCHYKGSTFFSVIVKTLSVGPAGA